MRILIKTICNGKQNVPFNYHLQLNNSIRFALVTGIDWLEKEGKYNPKHIKRMREIIIHKKLYTYSKFNYFPRNINNNGFYNVKRAELLFSTPLPEEYLRYFINIFMGHKYIFRFEGSEKIFTTTQVFQIPEPEFTSKMSFVSKSPIAVCTSWTSKYNTIKKHFYNYMKNKERKRYIKRIKKSLINKYESLFDEIYTGDNHFYFKFDQKYIKDYTGKISKLIHFENDEKVKAFEAPFVIESDSELIKIGYQCGIGDESDRGFGCIDVNGETNNIDYE